MLGVLVFMPKRRFTTPEELNKNKPDWSRLTAIEILPDVGYERWIRCLCDCGKTTDLRHHSFITGKTRSCGCYWSESTINASRKYIGSNKSIYQCYKGMIERCYKETAKTYKNYGGLNPPVIVCEEWKNDYQNFLDWALSNGWQKGLQLDKDIKYIKKFPEAKRGMFYSPEFCQFVTCKENRNTTSRSVYIEYNGEKIPVIEFCAKHNIKRDTLNYRLKIGYSLDEAISFPFVKRSRVGVETKATRRFIYSGKLMTVNEISKLTGIDRRKVYRTYYDGKPLD